MFGGSLLTAGPVLYLCRRKVAIRQLRQHQPHLLPSYYDCPGKRVLEGRGSGGGILSLPGREPPLQSSKRCRDKNGDCLSTVHHPCSEPGGPSHHGGPDFRTHSICLLGAGGEPHP